MAAASFNWLRSAGARAVGLLFPPICVACNGEMDEQDDQVCLCQTCRQLLPRAEGPTCRRCGARVPAVPGSVDSCHHCRKHRLRFDEVFCWGPYEGLLQNLVLQMKTDASQQVATVLGSLLVQGFGELLLAGRPAALVPIPIHRHRRHASYQGAAVSLAYVVGRQLGLPVRTDLLNWDREITAQVGLSQQGRFRNVHRSMRTNTRYQLGGARLVVVDDVLTTGATCSEAARVLKRAGAAEVKVLAVARTWTAA